MSERDDLFGLWSRYGSSFESDSSEGYELADAILKSRWLAEHDARVLEEAADDWGSQIRNGGAGSWLRERAAEYRKGAGQ